MTHLTEEQESLILEFARRDSFPLATPHILTLHAEIIRLRLVLEAMQKKKKKPQLDLTNHKIGYCVQCSCLYVGVKRGEF